MSAYALVSTVDSMGDDFPTGVFAYADKDEAYMAAATMLVDECKDVIGGRHDDGTFWWEYQGERFGDAELLLDAWQNQLSSTEYFHVMPIKNCQAPSLPNFTEGQFQLGELTVKPDADMEAFVEEFRSLPIDGSNAQIMPALPKFSPPMFLDRDYESFVRSIEVMNQMYRLQVSSIPTLMFVDNKSDGSRHVTDVIDRLHKFKKTLIDEIDEIEPIAKLAAGLDAIDGCNRIRAVEILTSVADLLADIIVFCVSEMRKFGLPPARIMQIVMQSNMSKLQPDGSAKYDDNGKFLKGPNYFPPEPKLKELITELLTGHDPLEAPVLS